MFPKETITNSAKCCLWLQSGRHYAEMTVVKQQQQQLVPFPKKCMAVKKKKISLFLGFFFW